MRGIKALSNAAHSAHRDTASSSCIKIFAGRSPPARATGMVLDNAARVANMTALAISQSALELHGNSAVRATNLRAPFGD
jgi:hypothetical protein